MGEIAGQLINGECCEMCMHYFTDEPPGYPRLCISCMPKPQQKGKEFYTPVPKKPKERCPICMSWIKVVGMQDHMRDKHRMILDIDKDVAVTK